MTREEICNSMTVQDAIQVFKDTNAYGTMDIAKSVILKALQEHQYYKDLAESYEKTINKLTKAIAEQQQKTGHWIMTSDYLTTAYGSIDYVKCSCCGEDSLEEGDYCPNCGAKMQEEEK